MGLKTGFPPPYLVTLTPEGATKAKRDEIARGAIETIERTRAELIGAGYAEAAQILDIALLQLSLALNNISQDELNSLSEALHPRNAQGPLECGDSA